MRPPGSNEAEAERLSRDDVDAPAAKVASRALRPPEVGYDGIGMTAA